MLRVGTMINTLMSLPKVKTHVNTIAQGLESAIGAAVQDAKVQSAITQIETTMWYGKCAAICISMFFLSLTLRILVQLGKLPCVLRLAMATDDTSSSIVQGGVVYWSDGHFLRLITSRTL
ncbi:hypothetical protein BS50DRAFT_587727 [Corynespora cassiicola Philippines]|uniref:Uncharacterized protein n=1 Tax=Corynespora cassiicola Philippines TaxID=1448308 RepID=A0A2T2NNI5_CORCC|nr:hypothetical protein BS50DRAFT_587727 [Corynespora cassiicola Philippines]